MLRWGAGVLSRVGESLCRVHTENISLNAQQGLQSSVASRCRARLCPGAGRERKEEVLLWQPSADVQPYPVLSKSLLKVAAEQLL